MPRVAGDDPYYTFVLKNTGTGKYRPDVSIHLPSVTTVIKATLAKPQLMPWYTQMTIDAISGLVSIVKDDEELIDMLTDADWLKEYMKENRLLPEDRVKDAGDRGHEKHQLFQDLGEAALEDDEHAWVLAEKYVASKDGYERAISDWWLTRKPSVVASEKVLYSLEHKFAGSLDLFYDETLCDLKSRKAGSTAYESDFIQVGAYDIAWCEMGGTPPKRQTVLIAREDGSWDEYTPGFDTRRVFLSLLDVYRGLGKEK